MENNYPANMPSAVNRQLPPAAHQYLARLFYGGLLSALNATVCGWTNSVEPQWLTTGSPLMAHHFFADATVGPP
jgi:hypothetical protein